MSEEPSFSPRLDMIETQWSMLRQAHQGSMSGGAEARSALVVRYSSAIRRYLRAIVKEETVADDLAHDLVVRMLKGDFAGADPARGRFRDLLKVAVRNMARNHWAREKVRRSVDYDLEQEGGVRHDEEQDAKWTKCFRDNVLDVAWSRLEGYQKERKGSVAYTVLRCRFDNPKMDSTELAERVSETIGRTMNAATYRQQLRRARVRFAEYIVEEIANHLDSPDPSNIHEELVDIGLFPYIKDVLPAGWGEK